MKPLNTPSIAARLSDEVIQLEQRVAARDPQPNLAEAVKKIRSQCSSPVSVLKNEPFFAQLKHIYELCNDDNIAEEIFAFLRSAINMLPNSHNPNPLVWHTSLPGLHNYNLNLRLPSLWALLSVNRRKTNKVLAITVQTCNNKKCIVFFSLPILFLIAFSVNIYPLRWLITNFETDELHPEQPTKKCP